MAYDPSTRDVAVDETALAQLFTGARTRNAWTDRPVSEDLLRRLYDLTKFGPTAVNATPARFVFITSPAAKARLAPLMGEGNREKTLQAPVKSWSSAVSDSGRSRAGIESKAIGHLLSATVIDAKWPRRDLVQGYSKQILLLFFRPVASRAERLS